METYKSAQVFPQIACLLCLIYISCNNVAFPFNILKFSVSKK